MALGWGMAYLLLVNLQPHAFIAGAGRPTRTLGWFDCQYYSFVTLTTLGYGDIVPMTAQARSLSMMEAMSGTMYVGILIARLVGLHSASKSAKLRHTGTLSRAMRINFDNHILRKDHK
jgi:hypothetical protein